MKTVSYEEFLDFKPCWVSDEAQAARLAEYGKQRKRWTALDVLALEEVSAEDRLWAVLREEFIDAPILHEFACRCAERALSRIENPDPRSIAAIDAKRKWLRGEIDDEALRAARNAVLALVDELDRPDVMDTAINAAVVVSKATFESARGAAWCTAEDAAAAAWVAAYEKMDAEKEWQVECLRELMLNAA